jgi:capsular polysaccharide transport system ATP-binding protein
MIALENITKKYATKQGYRTVLDSINFKIERGEKVGILGGNGAGKSTLIRIISGAEAPSAGTVRREMSVSWPLAFSGGFQGSLTGLDNLRFICRVYGVSFAEKREFVESFSELGKYLGEPVRTYSAGMRAKLAFAISLSVDFDCFLIDEIIAVGDARFQEKCKQEIFEKRKDRAVIMVSHFPTIVQEYSTKAAILHQGIMSPLMPTDQALTHYAAQVGSEFPA